MTFRQFLRATARNLRTFINVSFLRDQGQSPLEPEREDAAAHPPAGEGARAGSRGLSTGRATEAPDEPADAIPDDDAASRIAPASAAVPADPPQASDEPAQEDDFAEPVAGDIVQDIAEDTPVLDGAAPADAARESPAATTTEEPAAVVDASGAVSDDEDRPDPDPAREEPVDHEEAAADGSVDEHTSGALEVDVDAEVSATTAAISPDETQAPPVQGMLDLPGDEDPGPDVQVTVGVQRLGLGTVLESLLFVADTPVEPSQLARALDVESKVVEAGLQRLDRLYRQQERGLRLLVRDGAYQLVTLPQAAPAIEAFLNLDLSTKLSGPSLETLAVIAYRQPVTRAQIEAVRGVDCAGVLRSLIQRGLIEEAGRLETVGRPILYTVTDLFMQHFGLTALGELPPLETKDEDMLWAATQLAELEEQQNG